MKISLIILVCVIIGFVVFVVVSRRANSPIGKPCSVCRIPSSFGYSDHAEEEADKIKPMCLNHLVSQLESDYHSFHGRALVIEPAAELPCYVFQPVKEWREAFPSSKMSGDVSFLLAKMETKCQECGQTAYFLWVNSKGLTGDNFIETLDKGVSATFLPYNSPPIALCSKCCVNHVVKTLQTKHLSYEEVCAPKGNIDGFVIPMGY